MSKDPFLPGYMDDSNPFYSRTDFYEIGREYYFVNPDKSVLPIMTVVTGPAIQVKDPRNGMTYWAHPTCTKSSLFGDEFYIYVIKGQLTPVDRPSGEEKIFSEFVK